jgi:predicted DNA-binding ribbon-helix-helix protein
MVILSTVDSADNQSGVATSELGSNLVSRNVTVAGHRTSVRLEPDMWVALKDICRREHASLHDICTAVAGHKNADSSLTAAIRVFIMAYYRAAATDDGHRRAGHGGGVSQGMMAADMDGVLAAAAAADSRAIRLVRR